MIFLYYYISVKSKIAYKFKLFYYIIKWTQERGGDTKRFKKPRAKTQTMAKIQDISRGHLAKKEPTVHH